MASTRPLKPPCHHRHSLLKPTSSAPSSLLLKPKTGSLSSATTTTFSLSSSSSSAAIPASSSSATITTDPITFDLLQHHLFNRNFRQADEETRRLLILLAGDSAVKRGYVFFSEVRFIAESDLRAIDELWKAHSDNRFGYSVQRKIWLKSNKDFSRFFIRVGWMKKLDTEVQQYNYRAFPDEFTWELNDDTPLGHLPLTNALRGTQLLNSILSHPAFEAMEEEGEDSGREGEEGESDKTSSPSGGGPVKKPLGKTIFKPDYSF